MTWPTVISKKSVSKKSNDGDREGLRKPRSESVKNKVYPPHDGKSVRLSGEYFVRLYGADGSLKDERQGYNVITTVGKEYLAQFLQSSVAGAASFEMKHLAIGSNSTAEDAANTALGTELARTTATVSYVSGAIYKLTATFATGVGTGDVYEYGIFSSSAAGTMLSRDTESGVAKGANDTLVVIANVTFS
jgi:hypothetical protein